MAFATLFAVEASLWENLLGVRLLGAAPTDDPQCNGKELSCDGCSTRVTCRRVNGFLYFVKSDSCSGKTPYCSAADASCTGNSSAVDASCSSAKPVDSVQCPRASGYFPDFTSCTKYYICSNWEAFSMDCAVYPNTVYSQKDGACVPRSSAQCFTPNCNKADAVVPFRPDPRVYAVCREKPASPIIGVCDEGLAYDTTSNECVPTCLSAGRTYVDDKTYTECVDLGGNRFSSPITRTCPGDSQFDRDTQRCTDVAAPTAASTAAPTQPPTAGP